MNEVDVVRTPESLLIALSHSIGDFIQYWGFRRIHGQVWTLIYLADRPLHATEIVARLGVSKALVSLAINELLSFKLIVLTSEPERKVKTYVAHPDVFEVIRGVLRSRELPMMSRIVKDQEALVSESFSGSVPIDTNRLRSLGEMARIANAFLAAAVADKWADQTDSPSLNGLIAVLSHHESSRGSQSNQ